MRYINSALLNRALSLLFCNRDVNFKVGQRERAAGMNATELVVCKAAVFECRRHVNLARNKV